MPKNRFGTIDLPVTTSFNHTAAGAVVGARNTEVPNTVDRKRISVVAARAVALYLESNVSSGSAGVPDRKTSRFHGQCNGAVRVDHKGAIFGLTIGTIELSVRVGCEVAANRHAKATGDRDNRRTGTAFVDGRITGDFDFGARLYRILLGSVFETGSEG